MSGFVPMGDGMTEVAKKLATNCGLVVIDPEDRAQVERLLRAYWGASPMEHATDSELFTAMQAALRSLLAPPKPEEPLGLGDVVEDSRGELWVRDKTTTTVAHWKRARGQDGGNRYPWDHIAAVRVLSEGHRMIRVSVRRMEAALNTLADLTTEDHDELDGRVRDEFSHVIDVLDRLIEERRR